jgi:predicted amidophosphoribosyltransferase
MLCPNCGNENRSARPFCSKCGTRLAGVCSNCGASNESADQFEQLKALRWLERLRPLEDSRAAGVGERFAEAP